MINKVIKSLVFLEIILAIVLFVALNVQFSTDEIVMEMLESKEAFSALDRLTIYFTPGVLALTPLFLVVFDSKPILIFMAALNLYASLVLFNYIGNSTLILILAIIATVFSAVYIAIVVSFLVKKKSR